MQTQTKDAPKNVQVCQKEMLTSGGVKIGLHL